MWIYKYTYNYIYCMALKKKKRHCNKEKVTHKKNESGPEFKLKSFWPWCPSSLPHELTSTVGFPQSLQHKAQGTSLTLLSAHANKQKPVFCAWPGACVRENSHPVCSLSAPPSSPLVRNPLLFPCYTPALSRLPLPAPQAPTLQGQGGQWGCGRRRGQR